MITSVPLQNLVRVRNAKLPCTVATEYGLTSIHHLLFVPDCGHKRVVCGELFVALLRNATRGLSNSTWMGPVALFRGCQVRRCCGYRACGEGEGRHRTSAGASHTCPSSEAPSRGANHVFISQQRSSTLSILQQQASNGVGPPSGRWWFCSQMD